MGVDCRYRRLGFSASNPAAAAPAARLENADFTAANRNAPAITKQTAEGMAPASPVCQSELSFTSGSISRCGSGSHTVPS